MQAMTRVPVLLFAALALVACAQTPDRAVFSGHTCCNLHFANDSISDANWSALPMLAAGTPVTVLEYEKYRVIADFAGRRMKLGLEYGREQDLEKWARRLIVAEDPRPRIAKWPAPVREAVQQGKVAIGMDKEQVIASVGYPPADETPSLEAAEWQYWHGTRDSYVVAWDDAGRVKDVIADANTRSAVLGQVFARRPDSEAAAIMSTDAQRAAVRRVSLLDAVSVPDKPDAKAPYGVSILYGGAIAPAVSVVMGLLQVVAGEGKKEANALAFKKLLDDNRVDIAAIVRTEFAEALAESRAFSEVVPDEGDARFQLRVETYGIADVSSGSDNAPFTRLFLQLTAELSTPGGDVLWRQSAAHASPEAFADLTQSGEGIRRVARVVAKDLLGDLPGFGADALPPARPVAAQILPATVGAAGPIWQYKLVRDGIGSTNVDFSVRSTPSGQVVHEVFTVAGRPDVDMISSVRGTGFRPIALQPTVSLLEFSPYLDTTSVSQDKSTTPTASGYPMGSAPQSAWKYVVQVLGWTQVSTPAGQFRAWQLRISGTRPDVAMGMLRAGETGRFIYRIWYSPEIGRYVKIQHESWSMTGNFFGMDTVELAKYSPG